MSLDNALAIAQSGLRYTQRALATAGENVANAGTAGYTRKTVAGEELSTGGQPMGVRSLGATREVDEALITELDARRSASAAAALRENLLTQIEAAHGSTEDGQGIGDLVAGLRNAFTDLAADPAEPGRQSQTLVAAQDLASRLNTVSDAIGAARQQAQDGIVTEVAKVNAGLRSIADLTQQIRDALARGESTASLEDQRDQAVATLSESLEVKTLKASDGGITLIARGGIVLPLDRGRDALSTGAAVLGPSSFHGAGGTIPDILLNGRDISGALSGGRLGEFLALRDSTLPRYQAEADLAATTVAARFDAEGLRLFTAPDGSVPDPAQPYAGSAQMGFAGRIAVNPAVAAAPRLLRDGTHAVNATAGGPTAFTPNPPGGPSGYSTLIERVLTWSFGTEASAGNGWPSVPTSGLGPDGSLASPFAAPATLEGYGAAVTATQTADRAAASAAKDSAAALQQGLEARFAQRSGVDVDAEMAAMVTLQNAYAANAKVIGTVQQMWDSLLAMVR